MGLYSLVGMTSGKRMRDAEVQILADVFDDCLAEINAELRALVPQMDEALQDEDPRVRYWPLCNQAEALLAERSLHTQGRYNTAYEQMLV